MGALSHMEQQPQRRTPRFPFSAAAEITRLDTGATESTQVNELSLYGCYLDTKAPLPRGSKVNIKIHSGGQFFETPASVVYSQPTLGMGLAFRDVKPVFLAVLQKWLRQALAKQNAPPPAIDEFENDPEL
jgi:PilZ domain